jgi:membrane protease YdiL (CAAX protease family)
MRAPCLVLFLVVSLAPGRARADDDASPTVYTRREAVGLGILSSVFGLVAVGVNGVLPGPRIGSLDPHSYYQYPAALVAAVPLAFVSPVDAGEVAGGAAAFYGPAIGLRYEGAEQSASVLSSTWQTLESLGLHQGLYAAYATYRDARARGCSTDWDDAWRPYSASELIVAPFHARNLNHPVVIATLSVAAGLSGLNLAGELGTHHVGGAGFVARDAALGLATSFDAGVTEDALFRGFYYEEMQLSLGRWPARALDMTLFTLAHVPGEIGADTTSQIAFGLGTRAVGALMMEIAYDEGGLDESVALHSLYDSILAVTDAFVGQRFDHPESSTVHAAVLSLSTPRPVHQMLTWSTTF